MGPSTMDVHPPVDNLDADSCWSSASSITFSLLSSPTKSLSAGGTPNWNSNRSLNRCRWQGEETDMIGLPPLSGDDPMEEIQELLKSTVEPRAPSDSSPKMPAWKLREQAKRQGVRDMKPMVPQRSWKGPVPDLADEDAQEALPSLFQSAAKSNRQSPKLPVRTRDEPGALINGSDHAVAPATERPKHSRWDAFNDASSCSSSSSDAGDSQNHNAPLPTRSGALPLDPETRKRKKKIKTPKQSTSKNTKGHSYEESTTYTEVPLKGEAKISPQTRAKAVAKAIKKASQDSSTTSQIPSLFQIPKDFQKKPQSSSYLKRRNLKKHKSDLRRRRKLVDDCLASILEEDCENLSPMRDVDHRIAVPRSCPNIMVSRLDDSDFNEPTDLSRTSGDSSSRHTTPDELPDWEGRKSQWSGMGSRKLNTKA
eukprot:Nitzschia sp. Nitz4//scaffold427_size8314//4136//5407//NITZ4_009130-RA/size8314-processed-gene-0.5-mRNA-1//1//CDS//3329551625//6443//frame0